jgi:hypothetical protein
MRRRKGRREMWVGEWEGERERERECGGREMMNK